MKFLQLQCSRGVSGPTYGPVLFKGQKIETWYVEGYGYVYENDPNGGKIIIAGPGSFIGIEIEVEYRKIQCSGSGDPEEEIVFGIGDFEEVEHPE